MVVARHEPMTWALPEGYRLYTPQRLSELFDELDTLLASAKRYAEQSQRKASS